MGLSQELFKNLHMSRHADKSYHPIQKESSLLSPWISICTQKNPTKNKTKKQNKTITTTTKKQKQNKQTNKQTKTTN